MQIRKNLKLTQKLPSFVVHKETIIIDLIKLKQTNGQISSYITISWCLLIHRVNGRDKSVGEVENSCVLCRTVH